MLDDYEVEERKNPEIAEDIRVLGAVTYTGEYIRPSSYCVCHQLTRMQTFLFVETAGFETVSHYLM